MPEVSRDLHQGGPDPHNDDPEEEGCEQHGDRPGDASVLEGWCLPDHGLGSGQILSAFGTHPGIGTTSRVIALPAGGMPVTAELVATGSRGSGPAVPAGHRPGQRAQQPARSTCPEGGGPGRVDARRSPDDVSHADQGHREENEEESEHDESGGKTHRHPGPDRAPRVAISASSPTKADGERSNVVGVRPALGISMLSSDRGRDGRPVVHGTSTVAEIGRS